jgi:molybdopterin converting factor small subunit
MKVAVQLFGPLAQEAGRSAFALTVSGPTLGDVLKSLAREMPELRIGPSVRFAVNAEYARPDHRLKDGDVVALIPPVGGG